MTMSKRTLDSWGGVGSIASGLLCLWFALRHNYHESMFTVWVVFCLILMSNGILMILHARRDGGLPAIAQELLHKSAGEHKKAHV